jgi:arginyl-tRNA synthetase
MNLLPLLQESARQALGGLVADAEPAVAMLRPTQDARHGDYQLNCAMSLAKELGRKPRDLAQEIAQRLPLGDFLQPPEVAGPGFINLRFRSDWLAARLREMARDDRLGVARVAPAPTVVIDFSSPNVAKPMHVGHLRSTIIGDALARLFRFLGYHVITDNHLGDWGTQFGMLLYGFKHFRDEEALRRDPVAEMTRLYKLVREKIKPVEKEEEEDEAAPKYTEEEVVRAREVQTAVRLETAKLHAGDPENVQLWQQFMPWCLEELNRTYRRLDVKFDHTLGESFYNPQLADVVADLQKKRIAVESEGAIVIPFEGRTPALIRKGDGAFTYTTSDLATVRHRVTEWHAGVALYVVDFRQALHFRNLFEAARRWGYDRVKLEHISFGSVLDPKTRKPLKTREGTATDLGVLLDEAVQQAGIEYEASRQKRLDLGQEVPDLTDAERCQLEEAVGIGAVKYADLCQNRTSDYAFNLQKMVAMEGNTATYMQYAFVRTRGIFRKGGEQPDRFRTDPPLPTLDTPQERALGLALLRLEEALAAAAEEYQPSAITAYLWDLARSYSAFFEHCPVLTAGTPALRESRLLLCDLTARVIQLCLHLVGIRTVDRM